MTTRVTRWGEWQFDLETGEIEHSGHHHSFSLANPTSALPPKSYRGSLN